MASAIRAGGSITIEGTLNSAADTEFRLEFFSNSTCDPSGYGEGETFLGSTNVTTDTSGNGSFLETFDIDVPEGQFITATATDPDANTSEFSLCAEVPDTTPPLITPPQSITVEGDATGGADRSNRDIQTFLKGSVATDAVDPNPVITNDAPDRLPWETLW